MQQHPLFYALAKLQTRLALRRKGKSGAEVGDLIDGLTPELIDAVAVEASATPEMGVGGSVIDAILAFLASPQGQALIALLVKILLGL